MARLQSMVFREYWPQTYFLFMLTSVSEITACEQISSKLLYGSLSCFFLGARIMLICSKIFPRFTQVLEFDKIFND